MAEVLTPVSHPELRSPNTPGVIFEDAVADHNQAAVEANSRRSRSSQRESDDEMANLNDKLVNAINKQTALDDLLEKTRQELEASKARVAHLEAEEQRHEEKLSSGEYVSRELFENRESVLVADASEEKKQRQIAQAEKRKIESEMEDLTASLFEQSNQMVAQARREAADTLHKNQQLRDQLKDTESLLESQKEQLNELKTIMQTPVSAKEDNNSKDTGTEPASPSAAQADGRTHLAQLLEALNLTPSTPEASAIVPAPSTSFSHLIKPVCRTDLPAYEDFKNLAVIGQVQKSQPASRVSSGSYSGLNVMGMNLSSLATANRSTSSLHSKTPSSDATVPSTTNINGASASNSSISTANLNATPGSFSPTSGSSKDGLPQPLKDTKFYKRLLVEDIEPTLRLDLSPSISWLSRRSITASLPEGGVIVEPLSESDKRLYGRFTMCGMCGESRRTKENARTHRLRLGDGENATSWNICGLCLEKVRAIGDLVGFVRMIRDGVVRCQTPEAQVLAWEELVRLRERAFWARMAGGVLPAFVPTPASASRSSAKDDTSLDLPKTRDPNSNLNTNHDGTSTPAGSSDNSETQEEVNAQIQSGLEESFTTFDNAKDAKDKFARMGPPQVPPKTPPRNRSSGGFPKISIPGGFWGGEMNTLR